MRATAVAIKSREPILVVLGNPPYSGHSANRSLDERGKPNFIGRLIEDYKRVDGQPLGERNPKWLQDDYVKFIRFAQWRIDATGEGVVGYITNHGYLDNPTFRGMRQSLMNSFTDIYALDLHGNAKKREQAPGGGKDENVFDIQQGVAILLCVKERDKAGPARVHHAELWGARQDKYSQLLESDAGSTLWRALQPSAPFYLFVPQDTDLRQEYEQGWKMTEIFRVSGWGIATRKDYLLVNFSKEVLTRRFQDIRSLSDSEAVAKYEIKESPHWNFSEAKKKLSSDTANHVRPVLFRPFDIRFVYYEKCMIERGDHRFDLMSCCVGVTPLIQLQVSNAPANEPLNVRRTHVGAVAAAHLQSALHGTETAYPLCPMAGAKWPLTMK